MPCALLTQPNKTPTHQALLQSQLHAGRHSLAQQKHPLQQELWPQQQTLRQEHCWQLKIAAAQGPVLQTCHQRLQLRWQQPGPQELRRSLQACRMQASQMQRLVVLTS